MAFPTPTDVTSDQLFIALSRFGVLQTAELGYFNNLLTDDPSEGIAVIPVQVLAPNDRPDGYPPTYGDAFLDLTQYNLSSTFVLTGTVVNGVEGINYDVSFRSVTSTSATVHVTSFASDPTSSIPSLNVAVNVRISS